MLSGEGEKRMQSRHLEVEITPAMKGFLMERGYVPEFGARPLESVFKRSVIRPLSEILVREERENEQK